MGTANRARRSSGSWRAIVAWTVVGVTSLVAPSSAIAGQLVVGNVRHVCDIPPPFSSGKVVGHDVGHSALHAGTSYFFFGDTIVDKNADGVLTYGCNGVANMPCAGDQDCVGVPCKLADTPRFGTFFARTTDAGAADCVTLEYKSDAGGKATQIISNALNENVIWPAGAISANGSLYLYFQAFGPDGFSPYRGTGLAKLSNLADLSQAQAARIGTDYFFASNEPALGAPYKVTVATGCGPATYVYLFGPRGNSCGDPKDVLMVRTAMAGIEDPSSYKYWGSAGGSATWVDTVFDAVPIFSDPNNFVFNNFSVAYNAALNRHLAVYSCGSGPKFCTGDLASGSPCSGAGSCPSGSTCILDKCVRSCDGLNCTICGDGSCAPFSGAHQLCAAVTLTTGSDPAALTGAWSTPQVIHQCEGPQLFSCYQGFQHAQYAQNGGARIYVTGAVNLGHDYHVTLREIDLAWVP